MKTNLLLAFAISAAALPVMAADRVDPAQLPPAVKKTLDTATRGEPVKEITVRKMRERTVYDVELERNNAPNPHLRITAQGEVLSDSRNIPATEAPPVYPDGIVSGVTGSRLQLDELPSAAQQTVQREAAGREIAAIAEDTIDGRKAYSVQFRERGRNPWLYVAEDGTILRPTEKPPALGVGTTFSDTPIAVQQTIRREIGDGEIVRIDKENQRDNPDHYKISVKDTRGTYRLSIAPDGRVLENSRSSAR